MHDDVCHKKSLCNTVLHHLVTDSVDMLAGSRKLIKLLNRLGVCVSCDTHDHLVTQVAERQRKASIWDELNSSVFTVATVDNIDFLQSHAAVYCGDQSRSYHGTTIQVVQPLPSFKLQSIESCEPISKPAQPNSLDLRGDAKSIGLPTPPTTLAECHPAQPVASAEPCTRISLHKRQTSSSPGNSPHKHGKTGSKRRRTVKVTHCLKLFSDKAISSLAPSNKPDLQLEKFHEVESELESKNYLRKQTFAYLLQKYCQNKSELAGVLKPLRDFILPTPAQLSDHMSSTVYYMELLDESADSEETMAAVADMVNDKIQSEAQKWVDGKTYDHLVKVK